MPSHALSILLDEEMLTLNRAVGVLRRRNVPVAQLALGPSGTAGVLCLRFVTTTDEATVDRVVRQFRKTLGVRDVLVTKEEEP